MKTRLTFSAIEKQSIIHRALALMLFVTLSLFSKNSSACDASFVDSINGSTVYFFNTSQASNSAYWLWTFGDGSSSDLENPVHQYNSLNPYLVCLTVYDTANNCIDTQCDSIYFNNGGNCNASFYYAAQLNFAMFFNTSQAGNSVSYFWDFGDNSSSTDENPTHEYASTGTYTVCLTISDFFNYCFDTYCQTVVISGNGACSAYFFVNDSANVVYFDNASQASNSAYWLWNFGDGTTSDQENPVHAYNSFVPYNVCLTVYDTANNCSDTYCDSVYLGNNGSCQADFTYSANYLTVDFTNLSSGNYTSVVWSFGDNTVSYFNNPTHTYPATGYYYVCVTVSDTGNNCNSTACQYIYVNDTSAFLCNAAFQYTANGNSIHFLNYSTGCNQATWYWTFGDGTYSTSLDPWHQYASNGYYNVCLVMSGCGCTDTTCSLVYVGNNNVLCNASFALYPDSFQQGLYWGYNYSTGSNLIYYWWWGDGTYSTEQYPTHYYQDSGYYTICLSIYDTLTACSDSFCSSYYIMKLAKMDQIHEVIFVGATGVAPVADQKIEWSMYPNPASDKIRIATNAEKIDEIKIIDINGKVVKTILNYNGGDIELKSLMQQVYIVQSLIKGNWSSKLLIKQ